ncbi:MAG: N-acetyltransferase [Sphingomonadales bacterium]|nr:MAG: N-acetyltransferase [Sphingomonadales bacterium]
MELQPTLEGKLVTLRPTVAEDWDEMFAVASDPMIWAGHPAKDRCQEPVFRRYFADALASGGGITIRDAATGAVIGASRYGPRDSADEIEIGWSFLACAYWGRGYNREAKWLMIDHAHRFVSAVMFIVGEDNIRSRKAMENIGGVLRDDEDQYREMGGVMVRHIAYEIRRA